MTVRDITRGKGDITRANHDLARELFKAIFQIYKSAAEQLHPHMSDMRMADIVHLKKLVTEDADTWQGMNHAQQVSARAVDVASTSSRFPKHNGQMPLLSLLC